MGLFSRKVNEVVPADPRMKLTKPALIEEVERLAKENRVLKLQNARLAAERVMLQEIARQLQNMNQNQMVMLGDVINNAAGMLTDESVSDSMKMLASTVRQVVPTAVEDVITRLALTDKRTQGVVTGDEHDRVSRAKVIDHD
jgi:predicted Zn-dependent peptidase